MTISTKRRVYAVWLALICGFALLHALNLRADFPNHSPWSWDSAKYTDEGWYGNAAIHAHLTGNWYSPVDANPGPVVPVWPFLEWVLFFFTGVTIEAARGLAVAVFFANLVLSYLLLKVRGPRWMALLALSLLVTSPYLYSFSRLAILEPILIATTLAALNVAVRLPQMRFPILASIAIGLLLTLMILSKTSAVFLMPALAWAVVLPLRKKLKLALLCVGTAAGVSAVSLGLWMKVVASSGMLDNFWSFFFTANRSDRPDSSFWILHILEKVFRMAWTADRILIPFAIMVVFGAACCWRWARGRKLLLDPVFGASVWAIAGYILFMVVHNYATQRYFAVIVFFCFLVIAQGAGALLDPMAEPQKLSREESQNQRTVPDLARLPYPRLLGWAAIAIAALAVSLNGIRTIRYAAHPEYTFIHAAEALTQFIDNHPNGRRLLVATSGDEITLMTHLPSLGTPEVSGGGSALHDPASGFAFFQPGWFADWNGINRREIEALHAHFSLEQVASFPAFDRPDRNVLVLFKLHPLPAGQVRDPARENLRIALPGDKIDIPIE